MVMTPTMVMMTLAIAEMMASMPPPIAEKMDPYRHIMLVQVQGQLSSVPTHHNEIVRNKG